MPSENLKKSILLLFIPEDLLIELLSYLSIKDLAHFAATCNFLHSLVNQDQVWIQVAKQHLVESKIEPNNEKLVTKLGRLHNIKLLLRNSLIAHGNIRDPRAQLKNFIATEDKLANQDKENERKLTLLQPLIPYNIARPSVNLSFSFCLPFLSIYRENSHNKKIMKLKKKLKDLEEQDGPFDITIETELRKLQFGGGK